jgi:hypothetical protein
MTDSKVPSSAVRKPPGGSRKGRPNKVTGDVKSMVLEALKHAGGAEYLLMQAYDNPKAFLALVSRVLPLQVTGPDGGPVVASVVYTANIPARGATLHRRDPRTGEIPFRDPSLERAIR